MDHKTESGYRANEDIETDIRYFTKMEKRVQRLNPLIKMSQSPGWILHLTFMASDYMEVLDCEKLSCYTGVLWILYQVGKENHGGRIHLVWKELEGHDRDGRKKEVC